MHAFIIICPDTHHQVFTEVAMTCGMANITVLKDSDLLSGTHTTSNTWYIQQMLKLLVSRHVETRWYCTLDADVFLFRDTELADFMVHEKCVYNDEPISQHQQWWQLSSECLGIPLSVVKTGFGVTPSLLVTEICKDLVKHHNVEQHLSNGATEYTLYWIYLHSKHNYLDYYTETTSALYSPDSLWGAKQLTEAHKLGSISKYIKQHCSSNSKFPFFIFQSLLKRFSLEFRKSVMKTCFTSAYLPKSLF